MGGILQGKDQDTLSLINNDNFLLGNIVFFIQLNDIDIHSTYFCSFIREVEIKGDKNI